MRRPSIALALMACIAVAGAAEPVQLSAEQEAKALVGLELGDLHDNELLADHLSCRQVGGGPITQRRKTITGWFDRTAECRGRYVLMLERQVADGRYRIVDSVALPTFLWDRDEQHPEGPYLYSSSVDDCALDGHHGTTLIAIVREGKSRKITGSQGIVGAWTYDTAGGRIVSLSPKRVVCMKADAD